MRTFSLASLMVAMTFATFILLVTRLGYWPCVISSTLAGSLTLTIIPALIQGSPRYAYILAGAVGATFSCWLGAKAALAFTEESPEFLSSIEYRRVFWTHLAFAIAALLCACLVGCIIGVCMHRFSTSKSTVLKDSPRTH